MVWKRHWRPIDLLGFIDLKMPIYKEEEVGSEILKSWQRLIKEFFLFFLDRREITEG